MEIDRYFIWLHVAAYVDTIDLKWLEESQLIDRPGMVIVIVFALLLVAPCRLRGGPFAVSDSGVSLLQDERLQTSQRGYCSATSTAHDADPCPQSRILLGLLTGGNTSRSSKTMERSLCWRVRRSISSYRKLATTLGYQEAPAGGMSIITSSIGERYIEFSTECCWNSLLWYVTVSR
jgi:hypothetical protein